MTLSSWNFGDCSEVLAEQERAKRLAIRTARTRVRIHREELRQEESKLESAQLQTRIIQAQMQSKRPLLEEAEIDVRIALEKVQQKRLKLSGTQEKTRGEEDNLDFAQRERRLKREESRQKLGALALNATALRSANRAKASQLALQFSQLSTDINTPVSSGWGELM